MKTIFAIYDKVAGVYRLPMFAPNTAVMIRDLGDELKRVERGNVMSNHPGDFCLHEFGFWDDEIGTFEIWEKARLVVELEALVESPPVVAGDHDHQTG